MLSNQIANFVKKMIPMYIYIHISYTFIIRVSVISYQNPFLQHITVSVGRKVDFE